MKIDKGVELPAQLAGAPRKYPFPDMQVGDSIFVADQNSQGKASMAARSHGAKYGVKFKCMSVEGGVRIWRVL